VVSLAWVIVAFCRTTYCRDFLIRLKSGIQARESSKQLGILEEFEVSSGYSIAGLQRCKSTFAENCATVSHIGMCVVTAYSGECPGAGGIALPKGVCNSTAGTIGTPNISFA